MSPEVDFEIQAVADAIIEDFGCVIGRSQSLNIAYRAVVAARHARRVHSAKLQASNQSPAKQARMAGRFTVD